MGYSTEKEILQPILDHGMEGMSEVLQKLFNLAMKLDEGNMRRQCPDNSHVDDFRREHCQLKRVGNNSTVFSNRLG